MMDLIKLNRKPQKESVVPTTPAPATTNLDKNISSNGVVPRSFRLHSHKLSNKQKKLWALSLLLFVGLAAFGITSAAQKAKNNLSAVNVGLAKQPPAPTTEPSRLTGVQIDLALNKRPVTGIMIENSLDARPQSGLNEAGVVYEAIAEGGITRFLALFQEAQPGYIGPVRSVRPYYLDFLMPFDAAITHAGGSAQALAEIRTLGVKDLDHGANGGAFQRVSNRFAPHNLYTSMAQLDAANQARGYTSSTFTGFVRKKPVKTPKKPATPPPAPTAKNINFSISSLLFNPSYIYDQPSNTYARSIGGAPHRDERSGAQLSPSVVIAIVMSRSQNSIYSVYGTVGSGQMFVFQDGGVITGTWAKPDRKAQFSFTGADSKPIQLGPGQTWISIVSDSAAVSYAP